jgi:hypothetical protein
VVYRETQISKGLRRGPSRGVALANRSRFEQ